MHELRSGMEDTEQRWGTEDQDVASKLQELIVDTAGGQWRENHVREYHAVTNHIANSQVGLISQPSVTQPFFFNSVMMQLRHFSARNGCVVMSRWLWYQCEITRSRLVTGGGRKRISGPVEGECGLPAVGNQLVRGSVSPAPSVSHLLSPLGALVNLFTSHSSQRLCHSVLSNSYNIGDRK